MVLGLRAAVASLVGWLTIVLAGRRPESLGDDSVAVLRYQWRVVTYLYGLSDSYPGFRVVAGYVDPGDAPALLYSAARLSDAGSASPSDPSWSSLSSSCSPSSTWSLSSR
jgi:hypothetical protein